MAGNKSRTTAVEAAAIEVVGGIKEPYRSTIFREVDRGSEEDAVAGVIAQARAEYAKAAIVGVPIPEEVADLTARAEAWRAHVTRMAELMHASGGSMPELDQTFPELMTLPKARAEEAAAELPEIEEKLAVLEKGKAQADEMSDLGGSREPTVHFPSLKAKAQKLGLIVALLLVAECAVSGAAWFGYSGFLDSEDRALGAWFLPALSAAASCVASLGLSHFLWALVKHTPLGSRLSRVAQWTAPILGLSLATGLSVIRFSGELPADAVTASIQTIGAFAVLVVSFVLSLVTPFVLVIVNEQRREVVHEIEEAERTLAAKRENAERWAEREAALEARRAELQAAIAAPEKLRETFVLGMNALLKSLAERDDYLTRLAGEARSAYRLLSSMSPAMRTVVRTTVTGLRDVKDGEGEKEKSASGASHVGLGLLVLGVAAAGYACSRAPNSVAEPQAVTVICDGTGRAPELVCNEDFLARAFVAFGRGAQAPGSSFSVITTSGSYAETRVALRLVVPKAAGGRRGERATWLRDGLRQLRSISIPNDDREPARNQSDLLAALAVATREGRAAHDVQHRLIVAGDGWSIGSGLNFERIVESPKRVREIMSRAGLEIDPAVFAEISFCGLHNIGASSAAVLRRDALWRELMPHARFATTCRELFPAIPASLAAAER